MSSSCSVRCAGQVARMRTAKNWGNKKLYSDTVKEKIPLADLNVDGGLILACFLQLLYFSVHLNSMKLSHLHIHILILVCVCVVPMPSALFSE
jgi:hypothetical protein